MSAILVLDLGTSMCKAALLNPEGTMLAKHSQEYDILFPQPLWAEQDPEQVWCMVKQVLMTVVAQAENASAIRAISLSLQGEAVIPIDRQGKPLYNTILGMDTRTGAENRWLEQHVGGDYLYQTTGMPLHTVNTLPKLLWLLRQRPHSMDRLWKFVLYGDFLALRFCGEPAIDACLASRTQIFDLLRGDWSDDIFDQVGLGRDQFSRIVQPGEVIGAISTAMLKELGLAAPVYLIAGGHDQACAALGAGLVADGDAMDSIGTAEVVEVATHQPYLNTKLQEAKISTYLHVVPGLYLTMTLNHTAGILVRWFVETFFRQEVEEAGVGGIDKYDHVFAGLHGDHPSYKLVVPHFNGSGTPWVNEHDLGVMLGLDLQDDRYTLLQAILEGLVYELKTNLLTLQNSGHAIRRLVVVGGGAKSRKWLQMRASILNRSLEVCPQGDGAMIGGYLLAATHLGYFSSLQEGVASWQQAAPPHMVHPGPHTEEYHRLYATYQQVYPQISALNRQIATLREERGQNDV